MEGRQLWEARLLAAVRNLRFGSVEVVVHDGRVTQIETREKLRFASADGRLPDDRRPDLTPDSRPDRSTGGAGSEKKR